MKKIILDTSFLVSAAKFRVDWLSELTRICDFKFEPVVIDRVVDELKTVRKDKAAAKLALAILRKKSIRPLKTKEKHKPVDDIILGLAGKNTLVATQDIALKRKVRAKKSKIVTIRQKSHLVFG